MGIEFEYEPEGFQIGAIRYLPDLHLPRVKMWGEVKPSWFTPQEESKATALVQSTGKGLLLLDSPPDFRAYLGYTLDCGEFTISQYSLDIWSEYNGDHKAYFQEHRLWAQPCFKPDDETQFSERYRHAVKAALRERFGR